MSEENYENATELANYMKKTRFERFWYVVMRILMFVESFLWTCMDAVRAVRMRVAAKINSNYQQVKSN
jgi:hypothetical protein